MDKFKYVILVMILITITNVYAKGSIEVNPETIEIVEGSDKEITITTTKAAGRIDIVTGNNAVAIVKAEGTNYADADKLWVDSGTGITKNTFIIRGIKEGTTNVEVRITDVTSFDDETRITGTKTINVKVIANGISNDGEIISGNTSSKDSETIINNVPKTASSVDTIIYGIVGALMVIGIGLICYSKLKTSDTK